MIHFLLVVLGLALLVGVFQYSRSIFWEWVLIAAILIYAYSPHGVTTYERIVDTSPDWVRRAID